MTSRIEVITSVERRRRWPRMEKERLVAASLEPGVSASEIARGAGIHVSQLFRWRKELCAVSPVTEIGFLPVVAEGTADARPDDRMQRPGKRGRTRGRGRTGLIEIELPAGSRVRVDGEVDVETLRQVLDLLGAR